MKSTVLKFLILLMVFYPKFLLGQDTLPLTSSRYISGNSIFIGTSSGGVVAYYREPLTNQKLIESQIQIDPRIGYFPTRFLAIGATYTYGWRGGNVSPHFHWHEVGGFARFYLFMKNRDRLLEVDTITPPPFLGLFKKNQVWRQKVSCPQHLSFFRIHLGVRKHSPATGRQRRLISSSQSARTLLESRLPSTLPEAILCADGPYASIFSFPARTCKA